MYPAQPARATNGFAIASLVCSLVACGVGSVLAIIFGHVARSQIRKRHEAGNGLAIAGLVIGYLGVAAFASLILVAVVVGLTHGPRVAVDDARRFERRMVSYARLTGTPMRDARTVARALRSGYFVAQVRVGDTGLPARGTSDLELARAGWQLQFDDFGEPGLGHACLTIPAAPVVHRSDVREHRCTEPARASTTSS